MRNIITSKEGHKCTSPSILFPRGGGADGWFAIGESKLASKGYDEERTNALVKVVKWLCRERPTEIFTGLVAAIAQCFAQH
jgi:hypothetical protein